MEHNFEVEKKKQEGLLEKYIETTAWVIGGLLFLLGAGCLAYFIGDYNAKCVNGEDYSTWFDCNSKVQDLASVILGSTGLFWGLAGTVFFVYTIRQTKIEIKQQIDEMQLTNNSLISQRTQTTFFNLLENHKKTIEVLEVIEKNTDGTKEYKGNEALKYITYLVIDGLPLYEKHYYNSKFSNHRVTSKHPFSIYNKHKVTIDYYITNFVTILKFIDTKIDQEDKEFHFNLLSNHLSLNEKYLIGLYANVAYSSHQELIQKYGHIFLQHYIQSKVNFRYELKMYFPEIQIYSKLNIKRRIESNVFSENKSNFDFNITLKSLLYNDVIISLEKVTIKINENVNLDVFYNKELLPQNQETINLHNELSEFFEENFMTYEDTTSINVSFTILYQGHPYKIDNIIEVQKSYDGESDFETYITGYTSN